MKKIVCITLSLLIAIGMMAACTPTTPSAVSSESQSTAPVSEAPVADEKVTIAYLGLDANDWTQTYWKAGKAACDAAGYEYLEFNCKGDPQTQIDQVQNCISQGVTAIAIQPAQNAALAPVLKKAADAGVAVFSAFEMEQELGMNDYPNVYFTVYGQYDAGRMAGESVLTKVQSGKAGVIGGTPGADNSKKRKQGFMDAVAGKLDIAAEIDASWDRAKAQTAAEDMMTQNPDIVAIFPIDDGMALGVVEAVKAAGKLDQITIASINGNPEGLDMVEAGEIICTVTVGCEWYSEIVVEQVQKLKKGENIEKMVMYMPVLVTKDNVAQFK